MTSEKPVILCVDNNAYTLSNLVADLQGQFSTHYTIQTALHGQAAFDLFSDLLCEGIEIAMVISDYIMEGVKGDELLVQIHKVSPACIKILLTTSASLSGISNAINNANLYRYIEKPWATNDLLLTVEEGLASYYKDKRLHEQNLQLHNMNITLEKKVKEIEEKAADIKASINYAKRIQNVLLPKAETIGEALPQHFIYYKPKDVVSGDLYWFYQTLLGNTFIAAIDCTGHGVPGAFMSVIANNLLNKIVIDQEIYYPNQILNELTRAVKWVLKQDDNSNNRDGMDMGICKITPDRKKLLYAGAVHSLYYFQNNELHEIKATKCSIGDSLLDLPPEGYELNEVLINSPTSFYMTSDGFRDQIGLDGKARLMSKRFKELLHTLQNYPDMQEQGQLVSQTLADWTGNWKVKQTDDIVVVGFKVGALLGEQN